MIAEATIGDLQAAMEAGTLSSVRLITHYLRRIHHLNPALNAVIETTPRAWADAAASDLHRRRHGPRSRLEGVGVLVKDNLDLTDPHLRSTAGSLALLGSRPTREATVVERLRAAGAVILGTANLSEWANFRSSRSISGWSPRGGQTNNPYVLDRNPCGSSSGSAVAVAAGLATVAIGTETDGSIMCPAGVCGVVGVRPTVGSVPGDGIVPITAAQDTAGPLAGTVADAAAVLSVIADHSSLADVDASGLRGRRIGVWREPVGDNAEVARTLDASVAALRAAGATVVEDVRLPGMDELENAEYAAMLVEFKHDLNAYLADRPGPHPGDLAGLIEFNREHAEVELAHFSQETFEEAELTDGDLSSPAHRALRASVTDGARAAIDAVLTEHRLDAVMAPTNAAPGQGGSFVSSSSPAAAAGYPNLTVPAGWAGEMPLGMSFFAGRFAEPTLFAIGSGFERATSARRPPRYLATPDAIAPSAVGSRTDAG